MFKTKTTVTYCVGFYSFRSFQKIKDISSFAKVVLFSIGSSIGSKVALVVFWWRSSVEVGSPLQDRSFQKIKNNICTKATKVASQQNGQAIQWYTSCHFFKNGVANARGPSPQPPSYSLSTVIDNHLSPFIALMGVLPFPMLVTYLTLIDPINLEGKKCTYTSLYK